MVAKASTVNQAMTTLVKSPPTLSNILVLHTHPKSLKLLKSSSIHNVVIFPKFRINRIRTPFCCTKLPPWEPSPVTYVPTDDAAGSFLKKSSNIFETMDSSDGTEANSEEHSDTKNQPLTQFQFLKWPMWLLGPSLLLTTGMVPTLWLPLSSIFLGPNIASLLSLIGLDCIFNIGATLFLLMADSISRPKSLAQAGNSKPPFSYKLWNMAASVSGFVFPLMMLLGSQNGSLQPQLPFISFTVLLGPYLLLLSVQILTEMLTWHWQSPVWLMTPVVYEAYRVLQLMRGLKLGAELSAPAWMMHMIRGLVCWWILVLGIQLMRVAWFAGFTARAHQQLPSAPADS
ncbi:uncharacterized protein LOC8265851 [Ricinus communis]|uniref:Cytochrome P450 n=1 Tax=Ricinus communis TaxID=3988 RepID=B9RD67_RICCO|nr:uncharacterized protein LOC8265851 [Ricinus communis]XP_015583480.1 uncharacterized protein LOC8265851 [Ricinus communis]XP_048226580.1 uncharacterized protein LOC8265851 [Ricinus communis]XP_048226590.1 uncharacterized protein LOC8265851 [Ricinus communis]EEF50325.1 conserved hypothetical protein [Ricinus communis]|eukprot:XP_002511656.1 uncharacterized protein LOC8265851 [Ricinus communis]